MTLTLEQVTGHDIFIGEEVRDRIGDLIHNEYSPADHINRRKTWRYLGDGWTAAPDLTGRGFQLIDPDGFNTGYHCEVWGPCESFGTDWQSARVSWPSFGSNPDADTTRKWAKLIAVAADYAAELDKKAAKIILDTYPRAI